VSLGIDTATASSWKLRLATNATCYKLRFTSASLSSLFFFPPLCALPSRVSIRSVILDVFEGRARISSENLINFKWIFYYFRLRCLFRVVCDSESSDSEDFEILLPEAYRRYQNYSQPIHTAQIVFCTSKTLVG
jgi:hypothetical protein